MMKYVGNGLNNTEFLIVICLCSYEVPRGPPFSIALGTGVDEQTAVTISVVTMSSTSKAVLLKILTYKNFRYWN